MNGRSVVLLAVVASAAALLQCATESGHKSCELCAIRFLPNNKMHRFCEDSKTFPKKNGCHNDVCCCSNDHCNDPLSFPEMRCFWGSEDSSMETRPCRSRCKRTTIGQENARYDCVFDDTNCPDVDGCYVDWKDGRKVETCCCKGDLCNDRMLPVIPRPENTGDKTTNASSTTDGQMSSTSDDKKTTDESTTEGKTITSETTTGVTQTPNTTTSVETTTVTTTVTPRRRSPIILNNPGANHSNSVRIVSAKPCPADDPDCIRYYANGMPLEFLQEQKKSRQEDQEIVTSTAKATGIFLLSFVISFLEERGI